MSLAAKLLHKNQSTISHQIKSLEHELGVRLFQGSKTNRSLTAEGDFLQEKATQLFNLLNDTNRRLKMHASSLEGEIGIASSSAVMQEYLPTQLGDFCTIYPGVNFTLKDVDQQDKLFEALWSKEMDLGIVSVEVIPHEFEALYLFNTELTLLSPRDGPFAISNLMGLDQLIRFPLIAPPPCSALWQYLARMFSRNAIKLRCSYTVWNQETVKQMVAHGVGITILDLFHSDAALMEKIHILPLSFFLPPRQYYAIWRRTTVQPPCIKAYLAHLQDWALTH